MSIFEGKIGLNALIIDEITIKINIILTKIVWSG